MSHPGETYSKWLIDGGMIDLSARAKLRLSGADRVRYLNGQVSANVQRLTAAEAKPACVTTAKGRLCADVFIHATADVLLVDAEASVRESLLPRLERYLIADDATVEDVTEQLCLIHLLGSAAERGLGKELAWASARAERFGRPGLDLLVTAKAFGELWEDLSATSPILDEPFQETLRVEAGVPRWGYELDEQTLPPEAGLDRTHIDYHKGCYVGQEVISRLKSIGHVNRRLVGFVAPDSAPLVAGLRLFAPSEPSREIGILTSVAWSFALDRPVALGYLKRGSPLGQLLARAADDPSPGRPLFAQDLPLVS